MPVLLFPHAAYFLIKAYRPAKDRRTGRVTYKRTGRKWVKYDLYDPVQREHAHNYYLTLCPQISQEDRDKVASEWADIRHKREAEEVERERERRVRAMVEESEGVALNIQKVEMGLRPVVPAKVRERRGWMDVVMS